MKAPKAKEPLAKLQKLRGERFARSLSDNDMRPADFARLMRVLDQDVNNWKSRGVPARKANIAGPLLGKNPNWLLATPGAPEHLPKAGGADEMRALHGRLLPQHQELVQRLIAELLKVPK